MIENSGWSTIRIGVSACLLGEKVRYNGGHKQEHFITDTLGRFFTFVSVCPETGCGLPVPREPMHLEGDQESLRLLQTGTGRELTAQMQAFCRVKTAELEKEALSGFIFKKNSPSCGLFHAKVKNPGQPVKNGRGMFAAAMVGHFPDLPMEEEGRLHQAAFRENFLERVFVYRRWNDFVDAGEVKNLVAFHTPHKYLIMAHSPVLYRQLGRLTAASASMSRKELLETYPRLLMRALSCHATVLTHVDVLTHIAGYFKKALSPGEKAELMALIDQYRGGAIPLIAPLTLLRHYAIQFDQKYLQGQLYLHQHPLEAILDDRQPARTC